MRRWFLLMCVASCAARREPAEAAAPIRGGDVLVATGGSRPELVRYRLGEDGIVHTARLARLDAPIHAIAASPDGRWLAWQRQTTELRPVRASVGDPVWTSPPGCVGPRFDAGSARLVLGCPGMLGSPPGVLLLDLSTLTPRLLVGELARQAPAWDVGGQLRFAEGGDFLTRRTDTGATFVTHRLVGSPRELWPQLDGSVIAALGLPGGPAELVRLLPGGAAVPERWASPADPAWIDGPADFDPIGRSAVVRCDAACRVEVQDGERRVDLGISEPIAAIARVSPLQRAIRHGEDLATAPPDVLRTHSAAELSVLGVALSDPLDLAWSTLDRAGRRPWWRTDGGARVTGIGVGPAGDSHCIVFDGDERRRIAAIVLSTCAAPWLSPPLRPLWDSAQVEEAGLSLAELYFGPGVAVTVGDGARGDVLQELSWESDARGIRYSVTSSTPGGDSRLREAEVSLRLEAPGRKAASR
jgi:hypothetical protein